MTAAKPMARGVLEFCVVCSARMPLRVPAPGETGEEWQCCGCGTLYTAMLRQDAPKDIVDNVRRAEQAPTIDEVRKTLQSRGIATQALPNPTGIRCRIESELSRRLDMEIDAGSELRLALQERPLLESISRGGERGYDERELIRLLQEHQGNTARVDGLFNSLNLGRKAPVATFHELCRELLDITASDFDLSVCLSLNAPDNSYPGGHSLRVTMLAISLAASLELDRSTIIELGVGCLLHDLGMQRVHESEFEAKRVFNINNYLEVATHPVHTFEMLKDNYDDVSPAARMVAYQIHERCNGSGYPRGRQSDQIHDLAKIASLADTYVALVSPRPHRDGLLPYYAMEKLIYDTKDGLYDAHVMRGLLQTTSLFPVGSYVLLGDELIGRVLRTNPIAYARPVVAVWKRGYLGQDPFVINLAERPDVPMQPLPSPPEHC
ncbi:MAG: HD domain-containing protein [Pirellulaceae bacterium]|nr:HD domain-containing protein [Pirellulaceae bacterium]MDP7015478.1 HD domain-containing protein [Pirellulaceae bacterium]